MDRYINADRFIRALEQCGAKSITVSQLADWTAAHFEERPPAEDMPTVTAEWIYNPNAHDYNLGGYVCSNCHRVNKALDGIHGTKYESLLYMLEGTSFCSNCGAKMGIRKKES